MKVLYSILLLSVLVATATAAEAIGFYTDAAHPGKCVIHDKVLSPGEIAQQPNGCGRMICGDEGYVQFHSCGVEIPPPNHKLGDAINPDADYPDCCQRAIIEI